MFKRKLSTVLGALAITATLMMPVKKADAGVIVGILVHPVGFIAAATVIPAAFFLEVGSEYSKSDELKLGLSFLGLLLLDEDSQNNELFNTVPSYLIQEVQDLAAIKVESIEENKDGLREVIFTHEEVDEIFELADEYTSQDQLDNLRLILTTKAL